MCQVRSANTALEIRRLMTKRLLVSLTLAACCVAATGACGLAIHNFAKQNQARVSNLSVGMTKAEVTSAMGSEGPLGARNPHHAETFRADSGAVIEIWFYLTSHFADEDRDKYRPVIFENGWLIGNSWRLLEATERKYNITIRRR